MSRCRQCGGAVDDVFRFCPWCSAPQRNKMVEFFRSHPRDGDKSLRVSRYLTEDPQVRFSVWDERGVATAAVSLEEPEVQRLASFLARPTTRSLRGRLLRRV